MANSTVKRNPPVAPPIYRPQPVPKVLQAKRTPGQSQPAGQAPRRPVAPPVYRPEAKKTVQPKTVLSPQRSKTTPPPVYRPEPKKVAQPTPRRVMVHRPQPGIVRAPTGQQVQMKSKIGGQPPNLGRARVIQRMEDKKKSEESMLYKFGSFVAPKFNRIFSIPNIFEMEQFTSCICLIFNQVNKSIDEVMNISGDYRKNFEDLKERWARGGKNRPFYAMCPYNEEQSLSLEFSKFCGQCMVNDDMLGFSPLIVVVGHCSAGSGFISNDDQTVFFTVGQVFDAIRPLMKRGCTVFLTPCSTAASKKTEKSFQDRLIGTLDPTDPEMYVIGTNSDSQPVGGEVLALSGYTVKHSEIGNISMEDYKVHAHTRTETKKLKRGKKTRVVTFIPTAEDLKKGKQEEYKWKKR